MSDEHALTGGRPARRTVPHRLPTHRPQVMGLRWLSPLLALGLLAACAPEYRLPPPAPLMVWQAPAQPRVASAPAAGADVPPSYMVLLPDADGTTGQVTLSGNQGRQTLNRPKQGLDLAGGANAFAVSDAQLQRDFGAVMAARPALPERFRFYFVSRSSQLAPESVPVLNTLLRRAGMFSALEIEVVGHTDTRGDAQDNLALGMRRARAFAELLVARGVKAQRIEVASEGESMPLVPTPDNVAEPRNRRVEVTLR